MGHSVFVWPFDLIGGVYADLHGDVGGSDYLDMLINKVDDEESNGIQVSIVFDCDSTLVPEGHIRIACASPCLRGAVEAERSCMLRMIEAVRERHQLFPVDYNYVVVSEIRALYDAMKRAFEPNCVDYVEMSSVASGCHSGLVQLCHDLSVWLGDYHPFIEVADRTAIGEFYSVLMEHANVLGRDLRHSDLLADMVQKRNVQPEEQLRLEATVPMPMVISWHASYHTLRYIYEEAIKKFSGDFSAIQILVFPGGVEKAIVKLSCEPFVFSGEPAPTRKAALAKLFYAVIKFVNVELGYSILDFHHVVKEHQERFINRFDRNMKMMLQVAEQVHNLMGETGRVFSECASVLSKKLDLNDETKAVLEAVKVFAGRLRDTEVCLDEAWIRIQGRQVDKRTLEANVSRNA